MKNQELLTEILKQLQCNYRQMAEIERITKELGEVLSRSDHESAQLILGMRQEEMERASETKFCIRELLKAADPETLVYAEQLLSGECPSDASYEDEKICQLSKQVKQSLERTISIDKIINSRLAGKDSFYAKN